jgi:hypothetical protein
MAQSREHRYKMEAGMTSSSLAFSYFVDPNKESVREAGVSSSPTQMWKAKRKDFEGFKSRPYTCKAGALTLESFCQPLFDLRIFEIGSQELFVQHWLQSS